MNISKIIVNDEPRIALSFSFNQTHVNTIKSIKNYRWSNSRKLWHVPFNADTFHTICSKFPTLTISSMADFECFANTPCSPIPSNQPTHNQTIANHTITNQSNNTVSNIPEHNFQSDYRIEIHTHTIYLYIPYDKHEVEQIKLLKFRKWNKEKFRWEIQNNPTNARFIYEMFTNRFPYVKIEKTKPQETPAVVPPKISKSIATPQIIELIDTFKSYLSHKRYGESTINTYIECTYAFLLFCLPTPPQEITNLHMQKFVNDYIIPKNLSSSYQNQVVNGAKIFFREILKSKLEVTDLKRPRKEKLLPNVLSKEEIKQIISGIKNIKHKTMLSLTYGCGLRRSELINLIPSDVQSKRGILLIRQSKGKKDRIIPLSEKLTEMLREYYMLYKPQTWLFEGQQKGEKYSEQSLQCVLKKAVSQAHIKKKVTLHWLRHSYATHLLENGTDLRYIQEILGHKSSRTTEIYTHVSTQSIQQIKSPFDDLF